MLRHSKKTHDQPSRRRSGSSAERVAKSEPDNRYSFRRNRTITGTTSGRVVSTAEDTGHLRSPRVQTHQLVDQRRRLGSVLLLVGGVIVFLLFLVTQFTADVVVRIDNVPTASVDPNYTKVIEEYYAQRPIERLRFMLDRETFTRFIQSQTPEIAEASVDGSTEFAQSIVMLRARKPVSGWNINGVKRYVDATGTSFEKNYYKNPTVQIVDDSGVPISIGTPIASNRFLSFVGRLVGLMENRGYRVKQIIIPPGTTRQIELKLHSVTYPIKCSVDRPAGEQAEDIDRSLRHLDSRGVRPQYLDVRVSGKAFYR